MTINVGQALKSFFFTCDKNERERGDDLGIFIYGISWAYFGAALVLLQDPALEGAMKTYIYFDILCVMFIILHLWRSSNKKIDLPTRAMWVKVLPTVAVLMSALYITSLIIRAIFSGQMFYTPAFIFEYFRIIPTEELAFRGLGIEVFLLLDAKTSRKEVSANSSLKELLNEHKIFYIGAIASSVLFGSLHYRAYPHQTIPLVYLTLLGFSLAFLRFKYGLFSCLMLHAINNLYASATLGVIVNNNQTIITTTDPGNNLYASVILVIIVLLAIIMLRFRNRFDKRMVFGLVAAIACGYFFGSIFELWVFVDTSGLNRYLFVFLSPFAIIWFKRRSLKALSITGVSIGIFISDIRDFTAFFVQYYAFFIVSYAFYCYVIYILYKVKNAVHPW